jgi:glutathione peroxidase
MAFPCNNFGGQEPGDNEAITEFASGKGATYPVFGKLECENKDPEATHPLYRFLKSNAPAGMLGEGLKWNFAKFLCDANGKPIKRYLPTTSPKAIEQDILALLN